MRRLHGTKVIEHLTRGGLIGRRKSVVTTNGEKSAEAIVLERGMTHSGWVYERNRKGRTTEVWRVRGK
ncbi:MAG: hypothetical protein FWD13_10545, partial [Treponema sp.]|nr:hypothetical protein [Treponema sp.]